MNQEEEKEYQEKMGGPEMEQLQYMSEYPTSPTNESMNNYTQPDESIKKDANSILSQISTEEKLKSFLEETFDLKEGNTDFLQVRMSPLAIEHLFPKILSFIQTEVEQSHLAGWKERCEEEKEFMKDWEEKIRQEEREQQAKLQEIAINTLITDANTARKEAYEKGVKDNNYEVIGLVELGRKHARTEERLRISKKVDELLEVYMHEPALLQLKGDLLKEII